ncbi:MAG: tetratricopeptide repeat protein [Gaiellaceae bacterium]
MRRSPTGRGSRTSRSVSMDRMRSTRSCWPRCGSAGEAGVHVLRLDAVDGLAEDWATGGWERAIEVLKAQLAEDPDNANVLYNLACAESRKGRTDDALQHLGEAVRLEPRFADNARDDPEFVAIRGDGRRPG